MFFEYPHPCYFLLIDDKNAFMSLYEKTSAPGCFRKMATKTQGFISFQLKELR